MRVTMNKTKVMISGERQKPVQKAERWLCGVCGRGVGSNSIQCTSCHKWVHKKCSGIKGSMYKVMRSFICRCCLIAVISTGYTSVDIGACASPEVVDKFCYLPYFPDYKSHLNISRTPYFCLTFGENS